MTQWNDPVYFSFSFSYLYEVRLLLSRLLLLLLATSSYPYPSPLSLAYAIQQMLIMKGRENIKIQSVTTHEPSPVPESKTVSNPPPSPPEVNQATMVVVKYTCTLCLERSQSYRLRG